MNLYVLKDVSSFVAFKKNAWLRIDARSEPKGSSSEGYGFYHDDMRLINFFDIQVFDHNNQVLLYKSEPLHVNDVGTMGWIICGHDLSWKIEHRTLVSDQCWKHSFELIEDTKNIFPIINVVFKGGVEDVFEIRHFLERWDRNILIESKTPQEATWTYEGKDLQNRRLIAQTTGHISLKGDHANCRIMLDGEKNKRHYLYLKGERFKSSEDPTSFTPNFSFEQDCKTLSLSLKEFRAQFSLPKIISEDFSRWVEKGINDLYLLQGNADGHPCIQAGIPWFATLFGRDGIIAAEQTLAVAPFLSRRTLLAHSAFQSNKTDERFDAQPGKIIHEARLCERGNLGDVPFGRYYGTVDATPLFISLARKYYDRTRDIELINKIRPNLLNAINWLEIELSKGIFLTYAKNPAEGPCGLKEKGWKDGSRVLIHEDGAFAPHPIAVCEAQGYAYRALLDGAVLLNIFQQEDNSELFSTRLKARAQKLKDDFNQAFWMNDLSFYAIALDGDGRQCRTITSNPGHLLRTGIIDTQEKAKAVAKIMLDPNSLFSGWGIRTFDFSNSAYNAESYQLGGVWPHDTCEALRGLIFVGETQAARKVFNALFDFAKALDFRLPELITGHAREATTPIVYADSCSPQAWSASIPFSLVGDLKVLMDEK